METTEHNPNAHRPGRETERRRLLRRKHKQIEQLTGVPSLTSITMAELNRRPFPSREMLIEPFLRQGETALIWGASGIGKTHFSLCIAVALASAGSFGSFNCPNPRKVLLVDGEMHLQDLRDRVRSLVETGAVKPSVPAEIWMENLTILARQDQKPGSVFVDLTQETSRTSLRKRCLKGKFDVLIIDNFTTVTDQLEDENASAAFKGTQDFFLQMKQSDVATILIHHSRKDSKAFRGSQSLSVTFEVIMALTPPLLRSLDRASFRLEFEKFRAKGDARLAPTLWTLDDQEGWIVNEDTASEDDDQRFIRALESLQYVNQTELAAAMGVNKSTISRKLKQLVTKGKVTSDRIGELFTDAEELRAHPEIDEDLIERLSTSDF